MKASRINLRLMTDFVQVFLFLFSLSISLNGILAQENYKLCSSGMRLNGRCLEEPVKYKGNSSERYSIASRFLEEWTHDTRIPAETVYNILGKLEKGVKIGSSQAPLEVVILTNSSEPECREKLPPLLRYLKQDYVDSGLLRLSIHELSPNQSPQEILRLNAYKCASEQDRALIFIEKLLESTEALESNLYKIAQKAGLKLDKFGSCLKVETGRTDLNALAQATSALEVGPTPLLLIKSRRLNGTLPYASIRSVIDHELEASRIAAY